MFQKSGFVGRLQKSMPHGGQACRVLHSFLEAQHTTCITNSTASKDLPATISRATSLLKTLRRRRSSSRSLTQTPQLSQLKLKLSTKHSPALDQSRSLSCECLLVHRAPFETVVRCFAVVLAASAAACISSDVSLLFVGTGFATGLRVAASPFGVADLCCGS